jgi:hypothetical protein
MKMKKKIKIYEIIENENKTGFDLPLLKSYLIELISNKKYLFIFNIDNIILYLMDGHKIF